MKTAVHRCRSCGHNNLKLILSLGQTPLANALLTEEQLGQQEARYPLDLVFCPDCTLVQITETVPPEKLFREYVYLSSFSDTVLGNAKAIADRMMTSRQLNSESLVVEIASNDGYLLKNYTQYGIPVLGIEPALNVARVAEERGIRTLREFFDEPLARKLHDDGKSADVIHANNVLAHVADLNGMVAGIAVLLDPAGVAVIEVPYVKDLIDFVEFDTIYHEHLCYFSLTTLHRLFSRHILRIVDVECIPIHGGSLRILAQRHDHLDPCQNGEADGVKHLLEEEDVWGVDRFEFYRGFGEKVERLRSSLLSLLRQLKAEGRRIVAYGASAKGSTLLNYFGIGRETLEFIVDRNTVKQGRYTPGTHLPIYAPEKLLEVQPDYVLLLSWNFAEEILAQQAEYHSRGGRFIVPIPELKVI